MSLMERVSKLIHADIDALVDGSDEPEQVISQVVLDIQNQLMQLKTQIAVASGHERILREKQQQKRSSAAEWLRNAESAAEKKNDELARVSLQHHEECESKATQVAEEIKRYQAEVDNLKSLLHKLGQKLEEAQKKSKVLHLGHRLERKTGEALERRGAVRQSPNGPRRVTKDLTADAAGAENPGGTKRSKDEDHDTTLPKSARIDKMLAELRTRMTR